MTSTPRRICWDAWALSELLNPYAPDHEAVRRIADLADRADPELEIITSTLAVAEVAGLIRHPTTLSVTTQLHLERVERMWHESRVIRFDVSEVIAEVARDIVRTTASARPRGRIIRGADAVYLATADFSGADTLVTRDSALLAHSGMLGIHICPPSVLCNELSKTTLGGDPTL